MAKRVFFFSDLRGSCAYMESFLLGDRRGDPAFPGAEGFGAETPGGRYGRVIYVDTLADGDPAPPGSLRAGVEAEGPRIVLFNVSGTIELVKKLQIKNPYITIAGQTAPGDGIALKNYGVTVKTNDVVIRHLRIHPGNFHAVDGINFGSGAKNVVIDHCSVSWAVDENIGAETEDICPTEPAGLCIHDITVQWSMVSEALWNSIHDEGRHSMALLLEDNIGNLSFHHNLFAHNEQRHPRVKTGGGDLSVIDFVNNVIYNFGTKSTSTGYLEDKRYKIA